MTKDNKPTDAVNVLLKVTGELAECQEQRDQLRDALSGLVDEVEFWTKMGVNFDRSKTRTARKLLADTSEQRVAEAVRCSVAPVYEDEPCVPDRHNNCRIHGGTIQPTRSEADRTRKLNAFPAMLEALRAVHSGLDPRNSMFITTLPDHIAKQVAAAIRLAEGGNDDE